MEYWSTGGIEIPNHISNIKWFDKPFDRLTVLSKVEGLTTLSQVEGQITMTKIVRTSLGHPTQRAGPQFQNSKPVSVIWYWNLKFVCNLVLGVWDFIYLRQTLGSRYGPHWVQILVTTCLALTLSAPAVAPAADTAAKVVEVLHSELLIAMKQAKKLGYAGRYQRLAPTVTASYDFPYISKVVVGRYWRSFTAEQKSQFIKIFSKLSIATYANRFDGYSGERFKTISGEELKRGHRLVKTVLIKANGEEIELDYILHKNNDQWRIINVIAEGVSDLSLKRADYTSYLKKYSFDILLEKLNEKIKQYAG